MTAHTMNPTNPTTQKFKEVRDKLIELREDYDAARDYFEWPRFEKFNFALDWFDYLGTNPDTMDELVGQRWRQAGRPRDAHAQQPSGTVGNHARLH